MQSEETRGVSRLMGERSGLMRSQGNVREVHGEQVGGRRGGGGELGQDGEDEVVGEHVQVVRPSREPLPPRAAGALAGDGRRPHRRRRPLPLLPHGGLASVVGIQGTTPSPHLSISLLAVLRRRRRRSRTGSARRRGKRVKRPGGARCGACVQKGEQAVGLLYRALFIFTFKPCK